jgi:hypothetical protein
MLMFALTAALVGAVAALDFSLNPYGAWPVELINPVFRKIKNDRLGTPYLLHVAEPETLLVGSSRVLMGMRIEQGYRDGVMNAALTAATIPQLTRIVTVALARPRLKRIVWGVDFFAFSAGWNHDDRNFDARIAGSRAAKIEETLIGFDALGDGYELLRRALRGAATLPPTATASVPWTPDLICAELARERGIGLAVAGRRRIIAELTHNPYANYHFSPKLLDMFRASVDKARARGVDVVLFLPPLSQYELELIRQGGLWDTFQHFKKMLASLEPYYDFSGYNEIARRDELFLDSLHMKAPIGHQVLRIALGMEPAGCPEAAIVTRSVMRVSAESADQTLAAEQRMLVSATQRESRYSTAVADALKLPAQPL